MPFRLLTWLASSLLLIIFTAITGLVWHDRDHELEAQLEQDASRLITAYSVAIDTLEQQMLALASLLAADPDIQRQFDQGRAALAGEGGGNGGAEAARLRAGLLARVQPQWQYMQSRFGVRQLNFYLGTPTHTFLRVQAPERFGDTTQGPRPLVTDVMQDRKARAGFEIGRMRSGVRGVVPIEFKASDGKTRLIGAIETGTAFDTQLDRLDRQLGAGFAVLLKPEHVEATIWPEFRAGQRQRHGCDCYLEASSRKEIKDWLGRIPMPIFPEQPVSWRLSYQDSTYLVTQIPLRDYLGQHDTRRPRLVRY